MAWRLPDQVIAALQLLFWVLFFIMSYTCLTGCQAVYPRFLDSPEFRTAAVQAIAESHKTWQGGAEVHDPAVQVFYVVGFEMRICGVSGKIGAQGAGGPADNDDEKSDSNTDRAPPPE